MQPPPQFSGYPRLNARPRIRFESIGEAWGFFKAEMGTWVLAAFLTMALTAACAAPFYVLAVMQMVGADKQKPDFGTIMSAYGYMLVAVLGLQIAQCIGRAGMHNMAWKQINGEEISIRDFFAVGRILPSVIGASILVTFATYIGLMACYLPGLLAQGLLLFTFPILVRERGGAIAAMTTSWNMLKGDMWMALAFAFVIALLSGLGAIGCWIGIVFTLPLWPLAVAIVYRDFANFQYDPAAPVAPYDITAR